MGVYDVTISNTRPRPTMNVYEWVLTIVIVVVLIVYLKLTINKIDHY